jgi:hypothetical protein
MPWGDTVGNNDPEQETMRAFLLAGLLAGIAMPALASDDVESAYTDLDLTQCLVMESDDFGTNWACPGYKGMPTYVAEGDLRFMVSYGFGADKEKAAEQTVPPFNTLGTRIEWRLSNRTGGWRPFATIVRYFVQREEGDKEGQVLVVTRIEPGATCQTAYVDALANPDANELARRAADEKARDFDCANEPETIGDFKA